MDQPLEQSIEAILFFKGGTVSLSELEKITQAPLKDIETALLALEASLTGRGVRLIRERNFLALGTAPEAKNLVERMRKDELEGPLGKAGLETLAVIIFRGPIAKSDIDYIRGVNCVSILRSLMVRGLIERVEHPSDKRGFLYQATADLPAYLGVATLEALPQYSETRAEIEKIFAEREHALKEESDHV